MNDDIEIFAQSAIWMFDDIEFLLRCGNAIARPLVFEKQEQDVAMTESCFRLGRREAQKLMDQLWNCGIRPSDGTGNQGQLQATEKHLSDMKKIAFDQLGIDKK